MKALGIDVGSGSMKAALMESGWTGARVLKTLEVPLQERPLPQVLTELLAHLEVQPDAVCVGLDRASALYRKVQLPFSEPAKVAQAAPFAAEEVLPVGLDRVRVAHLSPRKGAGELYDVPVFAVPLTMLEGRGSLEVQEGARPFLQLDSVGAVEALLASPQAPAKGQGAVLLVDVGARKTTLDVVDEDGLQASRSLRIGCARMAAAAGPHLSGDASQLEAAFLRVFTGEGAPSEEALRAVMGVYDDLAREAQQTVAGAKAAGLTVTRVLVSGGGARIRHLPRYLGEKLGLPTFCLELGDLGPEAPDAPERYASAVGLARVACDRGKIGLDFTPGSRRSLWEDPFAAGILSLGLLLAGVLLAGKLWWQAAELREQASARTAQVAARLEAIQQPPQGALGGRIRRLELLLSAFKSSRRSTLKVVDALSEAVPVQGKLRFELLKLEGRELRVQATAESFVAAEDFEAALQDHPGLADVKIDDQNTGYRGAAAGANRFAVTANVVDGAFQ